MRNYGKSRTDPVHVTGEEASFDASSGGKFEENGYFTKDFSEIPNGEYWIANHEATRKHGLERWFSLFADDYKIDDIKGVSSFWNEKMTGHGLGVLGRGQFRMHMGSTSTGCITCWNGSAANYKNYNSVVAIIISSGSYNIQSNIPSRGNLRVYGTLYVN